MSFEVWIRFRFFKKKDNKWRRGLKCVCGGEGVYDNKYIYLINIYLMYIIG